MIALKGGKPACNRDAALLVLSLSRVACPLSKRTNTEFCPCKKGLLPCCRLCLCCAARASVPTLLSGYCCWWTVAVLLLLPDDAGWVPLPAASLRCLLTSDGSCRKSGSSGEVCDQLPGLSRHNSDPPAVALSDDTAAGIHAACHGCCCSCAVTAAAGP